MGNSKSIVFVIALAICLPVPTQAGVKQLPGNVRMAQADVNIAPRQAADIVRRATKGQVLSVNLMRKGNPVYRVKVLLSGGRVRTFVVDARTGQLLN